jgi:hypothetical protein
VLRAIILEGGLRPWHGRLITTDQPMPDRTPPEENGRVIRFRPRGTSPSGWRWPVRRGPRDETPVADLSKYERAPPDDDYRHRMAMNALALAITAVLIGAGIWLAVSISEMQQIQDCFLQGRNNCAPIKVPPAQR